MNDTTRRIALILALCASGVGVLTSVSAALETAITSLDAIIAVAFAIVVTCAVYLMPAVARRYVAAWPLWLACLGVVLYGHAHYNIGVTQRAGAQRAAAVGASNTESALRQQLAAIEGTRTPADVAGDVAKAQAKVAETTAALTRCADSGNCTSARTQHARAQARLDALRAEAFQAQEASELRARLVAEASRQESARARASADPLNLSIAQIFGVAPEVVATCVGVLKALVLELVAAMMWVIGLQSRSPEPAANVPSVVSSAVKPESFMAGVSRAVPTLARVIDSTRSMVNQLPRWSWPTSRARPLVVVGLRPSSSQTY